MKCKCGVEIDHAFTPKSQEWDYSHGVPWLMYEVCEHGEVTVDIRPKVDTSTMPAGDPAKVYGKRK